MTSACIFFPAKSWPLRWSFHVNLGSKRWVHSHIVILDAWKLAVAICNVLCVSHLCSSIVILRKSWCHVIGLQCSIYCGKRFMNPSFCIICSYAYGHSCIWHQIHNFRICLYSAGCGGCIYLCTFKGKNCAQSHLLAISFSLLLVVFYFLGWCCLIAHLINVCYDWNCHTLAPKVPQSYAPQTSAKTISKLARPNAPLGYGLCFLNLAFDGFTNATQDSITARYCSNAASFTIWLCFQCMQFTWSNIDRAVLIIQLKDHNRYCHWNTGKRPATNTIPAEVEV